MIDKHYVMYEELLRVPLIVRWPRNVRAGQTIDAFVSSELDLASTFCDSAGVVTPPTFAGQSILPLISPNEQEQWSVRSDIFATYYGNQFGLYSQRMVRENRWKYVWNATAEDELYDTITDPGELQNRAADPLCAEQRHKLRQRLVAWMQQTNDQLLNSWTQRVLENEG